MRTETKKTLNCIPITTIILLFLLVFNVLYQYSHQRKMKKLYIELAEVSYKSGYLDSIEDDLDNVNKDSLGILLEIRSKSFSDDFNF